MPEPKPADPRMMDVQRRVEAALGGGVEATKIEAIPAGLDVRCFYRVHLRGEGAPARLVARIDPKPGPSSDLESIRALLARHALPVPARLGSGPGIELLEDLGDQSLQKLAGETAAERLDELYAEACALVPRLQSIPANPGRALDPALIASKAKKWIDWTLPLALGREPRESERAAVHRGFAFVADLCAGAPQRLAHRDFKAANLILRPATSERAAELCMIDLQDAFLAPPEYDLVCLLRDSQVPLPEAAVESHLDRIRPALPDAPDKGEFLRRFDLITLVRVAKDISHFLHAASVRDDRRYLLSVPSGLAHLRGAAERAARRDSEIAPLAETLLGLPRTIDVPAGPAFEAKA